jgi:chromosomal replication initiator protein
MEENFPFNHFLSLKDNNINNLSNFKNKSLPEKMEQKAPQMDENAFEIDELKSITDEFLTHLENTIPPQKFKAFFKNTFTLTELGESSIEFTVTTSFIKKMIDSYYFQTLKDITSQILGSNDYKITINIINKNNLTSDVSTENKTVEEKPSTDYSYKQGNSVKETSFKLDGYTQSKDDLMGEINSKVIQHLSDKKISQHIDITRTFDNFIVGPSNNMAQAFALSVAKDPGGQYPQLYLYGNSGLGKTHLLYAICNHINQTRPELRICFTTANAFWSEMVDFIQNKKFDQFRKKYTEKVDVMIIDDIHELKNKTRAQTEFFHIFNDLQRNGKQLIFTSDKTPKDIDGIEERIKTRLTQALLIEIQQPDIDTRVAILKKKALEKDIYLADDVVNLIATCIKNNIRELEGSLVKLGAYSELFNVDIDLEIAKEQLRLEGKVEEREITIELIAKAVAQYYKVNIGDIRGKSRVKTITKPRHIAMYMSYKILKKTLEEIGNYYSKRDHTSVMHAVKNIKELIKSDQQLQQQIYEIESSL